MIEFTLEVPLARFVLRVEARLEAGIAAVMGPSGSGKTSLLESLAGLRRQARGRVVLDGTVLLDTAARGRVPPERRRIGYVPQDSALFPHLTAEQNLCFGARGDARRVALAGATLELEGLLDRHPARLSGGERQRVALGRALASDPRLLLLDEPLAAVDVELKERILPYLLRVRDEWRIPIVYVTHNVGEALALAGQVLLLREGKVEAVGTPFELLGTATFARAAAAGIENLLAARIAAHEPEGGITRVTLEGGVVAAVPLLASRPVGSGCLLAIRAEDVLVANAPVEGLSARNIFRARVVSLDRTGADLTLRCVLDGLRVPWLARLTPAAVEALGLMPGRLVWLAVKSHSVRVIDGPGIAG